MRNVLKRRGRARLLNKTIFITYKIGLLTYSSPKGPMLHQPSLSLALFARRKAGGDVENRTGVVWGDVRNRTDVVLCGSWGWKRLNFLVEKQGENLCLKK
jgi:hypothetical protein